MLLPVKCEVDVRREDHTTVVTARIDRTSCMELSHTALEEAASGKQLLLEAKMALAKQLHEDIYGNLVKRLSKLTCELRENAEPIPDRDNYTARAEAERRLRMTLLLQELSSLVNEYANGC